MTNLTILNSSIRTLENLYCLNDLHKLSGAEKKHQPSLFLRLETTKELLAEIEGTHDLQICRSVKIIRGRSIQGTYACEELALAYATWISPKFHLVVLRAFIAMHKGEAQTSRQIAPFVEEKKFTITLTEYELRKLTWLWKMSELMRQLLHSLYTPLELLGYKHAGTVYGFSHEYALGIEEARKVLLRATDTIRPEKLKFDSEWHRVIHELREGKTNTSF